MQFDSINQMLDDGSLGEMVSGYIGRGQMREIGGYIELDSYRGKMLYEDGIKLNCGRNALAFLIEVRGIQSLLFPKFMCDSCNKVLHEHNVKITYYRIGADFKPLLTGETKVQGDTNWLYLVNFYGQLTRKDIDFYRSGFNGHLIVDNAQAYYDSPVDGVDTLYTCRKYFGIADGAILYTDNIESDKNFASELPQDESYNRMNFLLGRYERTASEFYSKYVENNLFFIHEPIKRMSKLTENLLHGVDYAFVKKRREDNFAFLHGALKEMNELSLRIPEGPYMYPLMIKNGAYIRKELQEEKIYIPTLWPAVFNIAKHDDLEYEMAENILPLPIDQRYGIEEMKYLIERIYKHFYMI